ncbi:MAG: hypothetical protein QOJ50_992, partial [Cryptosporangiaceae bacterium]|nr:hypothetical protein [Cryptosporangiaceae bacterium]
MTTTTYPVPGPRTAPAPAPGPAPRTPAVDVVVPVYNEQASLAHSITRLHQHLSAQFPYPFRITIADNASVDGTWGIAQNLAAALPGVEALHLSQKGRGRALQAAWSRSDAEVLVYMDVDLSTDLAALLPLVAPLLSGHSDLAIGSRLAPSSRVVRGAKREVISRGYNLLLRGTMGARFSDAQCGFKAIRADVARRLLPLVEDPGWFFDTELLVLAERSGMRIHEVPVDWVDDPDSRVDIVATALADLRGMARVTRSLATGAVPIAELRAEFGRNTSPRIGGQLARFALVGALCTIAYLALFLLLRGSAGAFGANLLALAVTAVGNTAANRRLTFGFRGRDRAARHYGEGLAVFALGLALSTGALALVPSAASASVQLTALVAANVVTTALRFVLLRTWVFSPRRNPA